MISYAGFAAHRVPGAILMANPEAELPDFVSGHQAARAELRRKLLERVKQLTREGSHAEAQALWDQAISNDSNVA